MRQVTLQQELRAAAVLKHAKWECAGGWKDPEASSATKAIKKLKKAVDTVPSKDKSTRNKLLEHVKRGALFRAIKQVTKRRNRSTNEVAKPPPASRLLQELQQVLDEGLALHNTYDSATVPTNPTNEVWTTNSAFDLESVVSEIETVVIDEETCQVFADPIANHLILLQGMITDLSNQVKDLRSQVRVLGSSEELSFFEDVEDDVLTSCTPPRRNKPSVMWTDLETPATVSTTVTTVEDQDEWVNLT